jgi:CHASE2 domain-containing sensor protein
MRARAVRPGRVLPLLVGAAAIGLGAVLGTNPSVLDALLDGPILLRALLTAVASLIGVWLVAGALGRLAGDADRPRPFPEMVRGVRLVFLAVAAFAAAVAFLVGHPLPLVVALIIAGVDVVETAFLLLVGGPESPRDGRGEPEG